MGNIASIQRGCPLGLFDKWDFLSTRKVWKHELQTHGGSVLGLAKDIVKTHTPLRPTDTPPPLLPLVLQSSARFLTSAKHKSLYDKISTLFLSHFRVWIPYRLPLKFPLLHAPLNKLLHLEICQTIDEVQHWPSCLRSYIKSRAIDFTKNAHGPLCPSVSGFVRPPLSRPGPCTPP